MPNTLTHDGLQTKTVSEIVAAITAAFQAIYGTDINVDQSSPDGQMINIFAQAVADNLELAVAIFNSMSVAASLGRTLDQRVALNGIYRKPGTYTLTPVVLVITESVTLLGLDDAIADPNGAGFTVSDDAGNQYILTETQVFVGAETRTVTARARNLGKVETTPNTITNLVTIVRGVSSVNNPSAASIVGQDEESDVALKIRHARSFKLASVGPADAIEAALLEVEGVTDAFVPENNTDTEEGGVPAYGIWCIVENGDDTDVATAIYTKKAPGIPMAGGVSVPLARPDGTTFTALFDRPISEDLHMKFSLLPKVDGASFDEDLIKASLAAALSYRLNQKAHVGDIVRPMETIQPDAILTDVQVSKDGSSWFSIVTPTTFQNKFSVDVSRITII